MTKEERAKKWFLKIPDAEYISMETKMNICSKVAKKNGCYIFHIIGVGMCFNFYPKWR